MGLMLNEIDFSSADMIYGSLDLAVACSIARIPFRLSYFSS